jgi:hypothetical protein
MLIAAGAAGARSSPRRCPVRRQAFARTSAWLMLPFLGSGRAPVGAEISEAGRGAVLLGRLRTQEKKRNLVQRRRAQWREPC